MKKIFAVLVAVAAVIGFAPAAFANTGILSQSEFFSIDYTYSQSDVASTCNCTGTNVSHWTSGGTDYHQIDYDNSYQTDGVMLVYAKNSSGVWKFYKGTDCLADGCIYSGR